MDKVVVNNITKLLYVTLFKLSLHAESFNYFVNNSTFQMNSDRRGTWGDCDIGV